MSKAITAVAERLTPGTAMVCLENTYIPHRAGMVLVIDRQGKRAFDAHLEGEPERSFRLELRPGLRMLDQDTYRAPIGRDDHTATWRILPATP